MDRSRLKEEVAHGTVEFPLAVYTHYEDTELQVKLHWHEETEIIFLEKGNFHVDINMKRHKVTQPSFLFVGSGDIHAIRGEQGCLESAVVFDLQMLSFEHFDGVQYEIIKPLIEKRMQFPALITKDDGIWEELELLYAGIMGQAVHKSLSAGIRVKAYLLEMLGYFHENQRFVNMDTRDSYDSSKIENIKKVLLYVRENYSKRIAIKEMAEILQMNEQYFCRYFKKITGKTPTSYINEVRIEMASLYLRRTDRKIIDIAMECGYDNMGYFIKRFREQKGMSPSEYRNKSQNSVINNHN